jgi:trimethylamine---corrinoid protein Co-methyltransferase
MGDVGTWMIDCAYAQVGKALGLPTHAYLGMSDAKTVDVQCGLESAGGTLIAALSGINMVSGAGMLDFESCQSMEKLVIDCEIIGMAKRLLRGVEAHEDPIAVTLLRRLGHRAEYLGDAHTLKWFRSELHFPSSVIDRGSFEGWKRKGGKNAFERASERVSSLVSAYQTPTEARALGAELRAITGSAASKFGMEKLPPLPDLELA